MSLGTRFARGVVALKSSFFASPNSSCALWHLFPSKDKYYTWHHTKSTLSYACNIFLSGSNS